MVLVFEDLQWADPELLDFVDHLLDWSRDHQYSCSGWRGLRSPTAGRAGAQADEGSRRCSLSRWTSRRWTRCSEGSCPGCPTASAPRSGRSVGIPLYAVETVRMLLDRGAIGAKEAASYRPARSTTSTCPNLQTLIQARLDGLAPNERSLLQEAAVLGKTFPPDTLAELTGRDEVEVRQTLESLVRREFLGIQTDGDPPSVASLVPAVDDAAGRVRHAIAARPQDEARRIARLLESTWSGDEDEIVEVIASHYVDAYRADPEANDAIELRSKARQTSHASGRAGTRPCGDAASPRLLSASRRAR